MEIRYAPNRDGYQQLSTEQLRSAFLVDSLFTPGAIALLYSDADRAVIGSAVPDGWNLTLGTDPELRAAFFCERRELGILNVGGPGVVEVDGRVFELGNLDALYVGRSSRDVRFSDGSASAAFYLLSYPAHAMYPTTMARRADAATVDLGTTDDANRRTIYKYIHPGGIQSCQLVMGYTQLHDGSVWNTMPPHTHARRTEVYLYFNLGANRRVMHFLGTPENTRHLVMADRQAVISPSWSIHCACGTGAYTFCWGMGGENQDFADMDAVALDRLR